MPTIDNKTIKYFKSFSARLEKMRAADFENMALELFYFQAKENLVYRSYLEARNISVDHIQKVKEIPFLPIQFFKNHDVICGGKEVFPGAFSSSGTTGTITSKHYYWSERFYLDHAEGIFNRFFGPLENYHVLALLPAYLERKGSSLVAMADHFIKKSSSDHSGFYLYEHEQLVEKLRILSKGNRKVLLLGVTFALLDLAEAYSSVIPRMDNLIVMETGGMKGRRKEMIREEVHHVLQKSFGLSRIHSEYGMTELMSQAYSFGKGKYTLPTCMGVYLRDPNDPFSWSPKGQGGINVIDLANFHSCAFIETQDLGRLDENGELEVLGRFDNSDVRGCNLMVN